MDDPSPPLTLLHIHVLKHILISYNLYMGLL